jgi:hypothetical protein
MAINTVFDDIIKHIDSFSETKMMEAIFSNTEILEEMENLQRVQLLDNENADGGSLGQYSKGTEKYNAKRSTKVMGGDPIILKNTGEFHDKIVALRQKDVVKMDSKAEVTSKLKKKEGENILGLNEGTLSTLRDFIIYTNIPQTILYNTIRWKRTR